MARSRKMYKIIPEAKDTGLVRQFLDCQPWAEVYAYQRGEAIIVRSGCKTAEKLRDAIREGMDYDAYLKVAEWDELEGSV